MTFSSTKAKAIHDGAVSSSFDREWSATELEDSA